MGLSSSGRNAYAGGFHQPGRSPRPGGGPTPLPADDGAGLAAFRTPPRRPARRLQGRLALAALVCLGALALAWRAGDAERPTPEEPAPAPKPEWIERADAPRLVDLDYAEAVGLAQAHRVLTRPADGARRDVFALGEADGPLLRLSTQRGGADAPSPFYVEMARAAAETGRAVAFATQPSPLATRLGTFEAADFALSREGGRTLCVGFRNAAAGEAALRVSGFACAEPDVGEGRGLRRSAACLVDSLELAPSVSDAGLERLFAARELASRTDCVENDDDAPPMPEKLLRSAASRGFSAP